MKSTEWPMQAYRYSTADRVFASYIANILASRNAICVDVPVRIMSNKNSISYSNSFALVRRIYRHNLTHTHTCDRFKTIWASEVLMGHIASVWAIRSNWGLIRLQLISLFSCFNNLFCVLFCFSHIILFPLFFFLLTFVPLFFFFLFFFSSLYLDYFTSSSFSLYYNLISLDFHFLCLIWLKRFHYIHHKQYDALKMKPSEKSIPNVINYYDVRKMVNKWIISVRNVYNTWNKKCQDYARWVDSFFPRNSV